MFNLERVLLLGCFAFSSISYAAELRIATAANFYPALNKIKQNYEKISGNKLTIIRGSSGKLYAQIIHGAPFDIFFSADSMRVDELVKLGKSFDSKTYVYASGQLVLWKPDAQSSQNLREQLVTGQFNKLAIANPKTAPYGKASIEALQAMELYADVKSKLVYGENISQAQQFAQAGAADLAFVARSYVKDDIYWEIDTYLHSPIKQKVVLLKQSKQPQIASEFLKFIQTPAIKKLIMAEGYEL